jgi:hypothetical protein
MRWTGVFERSAGCSCREIGGSVIVEIAIRLNQPAESGGSV